MALDPSIALDFHPAQIAPPENPLAAYGQALQIANGAQNLQAGQQKLQSNALELQQQQRQADYQEAFNEAIQANTTQAADGSFQTDMGGAQKHLTAKGFGPEAIALNPQIAAARKAVLENAKLQNEVDTQHVQNLTSALNTLPEVDPAAPDAPFKMAAFKATFPSVVQTALQRGATPQQVQPLVQAFQQGGGEWTPQLGELISGGKKAALNAQQAIEHTDRLLKMNQEQPQIDSVIKKNNVETANANETLADKQKSSLAGAASQVNALADYQAALAADKTGAAKALPQNLTEDDFKPENLAKTQERIRTSVMNADQLAAYNLHKDAQADRDLTAKSNAQARQFHEQIMGVLAEGKESPGAKLARTQIEKDTAQEIALRNKLATLNAQLGTDGTKTPTVYVPDNPREQPVLIERKLGNPVNPDDAAAVAKREKDRQGLIADMQARRTNLLSQLGNVVNHKYDVADKVGVGGSTSRDEVLGDLEKMGWKAPAPAAKAAPAAQEPAAQTPAPAASAPAKPTTGKTATMGQAQAYADKYKIPLSQAVAKIKGEGFTISEQN